MIRLKKVFLIAFFAVFLMPLSAFASSSAPPFHKVHKSEDCAYYLVFRYKSSGKYYALCSKSEFFYENKDGNPYFDAPDYVREFEYDPSAGWVFSGTISKEYDIYPYHDIEFVKSNFDIKYRGHDDRVFFSGRPPYLMELEDMPGMIIHQAGGIISVVLTVFAILLAVGLVPRLRRWFLRF